ncbi:MAG TPA: hypothetical protein VMF08_18585 [Candidatus Sulfotelmatobacter sp.]|nr:hypothetical protein [Candidatus Sulfotelmatobacter sp.]
MTPKFKHLSPIGYYFRCAVVALGLGSLACQAQQQTQPTAAPAPTAPANPLPAVANPPPPPSYTNGLPDDVLLGLIMVMGNTNLATGTGVANDIALDYCKTVTDGGTLYVGLTNGFISDGCVYTYATNAATAIVNTFVPANTELSNLVFLSLTTDFPTHNSNVTRLQAYSIAGKCANTKTPASLFSNLMAAFDNYGLTNGSTSSTNTATAICEVVFNSSSTAPFPATETPIPPTNFGKLLFWTGAKLLSPYTINGSSQQLQANSAQANAFIEIDFDQSYVLQDGPGDLRWNGVSGNHGFTPNDGLVHWAPPWYDVFDVSGSFGYVFGPGNSTNSFSATTIVSTGDIYGGASLGIPILRLCSLDASWKQQLTFTVQGGFATDRAFDSVHPNVLVGLGYQGKFPISVGTNNLPVYWMNKLGPAWIDQPGLNGTNVVFSSGNTGGLSEPVFRLKFVPFCWQSKIIIPVTQAVNIQCGGDVYIGSKPANWDITLGASLDLEQLLSSITSSLGLAAKQ